MKKILYVLAVLLLLQNFSCAQENISFVYINGSNNNDEKMQNWFEKGVHKLHPKMRESFVKNKEAYNLFLKDGQYSINEEPVIFFWGDKSKTDLKFVEQQLDISKAFSPTIAYGVRSLIAGFLHDAIWVQKSHHMLPIIDELNNMVKAEAEKGNKVVLYGYSAGSFITYEYMFNKLRYLNVDNLFDAVEVSEDIRDFVGKNPMKNTCISALSKAQLGAVTSDGHLVVDKNPETFKQNYLKLDEATEAACVPQGVLKGVVNFASPLVLFYSDLADPDYELTYYNKFLLKNIIEDGLFLLTVNFKEDPMGYPSTQNLTLKDMENKANINLKEPKGFVFDNSTVWSKRTFLLAHTSYWSARRTFSKEVAKSYVIGYKFLYDKDFQLKLIKKRKYTSDL